MLRPSTLFYFFLRKGRDAHTLNYVAEYFGASWLSGGSINVLKDKTQRDGVKSVGSKAGVGSSAALVGS